MRDKFSSVYHSAAACDLISVVKSILVALLFLNGVGVGQSISPRSDVQCDPILKIESTLYAGTKDETVDSLTLCQDGTVKSYHSFTTPAFGSTPPEFTKWDYTGQIEKGEVSDVKKLVNRDDILGLPEHLNLATKPTRVDSTIRFVFLEKGSKRSITLIVPYAWCDEQQIPKPARDLICLFGNLGQRGQPATTFDGSSCGCRSLHEMASN